MPTIWISTASTDVITKGGDPGDHWQRVGVIDSTQTDFHTHIQVAIGKRNTSKGKAQFYLNGDPDSEWVQQAKSPSSVFQPFWLLVNPLGDYPIHYGAGAIKYLLSTDKRNDQDLWIWEGVPSRKYDPGSHLIKSALQRWRKGTPRAHGSQHQ